LVCGRVESRNLNEIRNELVFHQRKSLAYHTMLFLILVLIHQQHDCCSYRRASNTILGSYLNFLFGIVNRKKGTCTKRKLRYVQSPFSAWIRENSLPRLVTLGKDTLEKPIKHSKGLGFFEGMAQIWSRAIYESIEWKKHIGIFDFIVMDCIQELDLNRSKRMGRNG